MNLQTQIKEELWQSIRSSYEAEHYTHAIRDAMVFVTEVLRDKSGLDGDGRNLVGRALGFSPGDPPRIQVNKLETQTERDIQTGLREVLSGMYALVRNPRTHERVEDDKETADAIINFIDYLLDYLGESQSAFTIQGFVSRVDDEYFVHEREYVAALVSSVPVRKRADTMIALYRSARWKKARNFEMVLKALIRNASDVELDYLYNAVSRTLEETNQASAVSLVRKLFPVHDWPRISEVARLRAENILIDELKNAWFDVDTDATHGTAATWLSGLAPYMSLRKSLRNVLISLLYDDHYIAQNFVAKYLFEDLPQMFRNAEEIERCAKAIAHSITEGNEFVEIQLCIYSSAYPESWYGPLGEALKDLTDPQAPKWNLPDGTPLLAQPAADDEGDIPF